MDGVPVIDISRDPDVVHKEIDEACKKWGFIVVSGHGISNDLIDRMFSINKTFFDQPVEHKEQFQNMEHGRGYYAVRAKALAKTLGIEDAPPDEKETFSMGQEGVPGDPYYETEGAKGFFYPNIWPNDDMKAVYKEYDKMCVDLSQRLLDLMHCPMRSDKPISNLIVHNYPKQDVSPEGIRAGMHTDFGSLTLLLTEDKPGGLQVMGLDEEWHDVKPLPYTFIVNLGDLMPRWNPEWRSTLHRVTNPPVGSESRRMSIVYFHAPNYETEVDGTTSGEHLMMKFGKNKNLEIQSDNNSS
jgi:isopenicillin N synthase-like dioxygenase